MWLVPRTVWIQKLGSRTQGAVLEIKHLKKLASEHRADTRAGQQKMRPTISIVSHCARHRCVSLMQASATPQP